jgi:hypothetical protein
MAARQMTRLKTIEPIDEAVDHVRGPAVVHEGHDDVASLLNALAGQK